MNNWDRCFSRDGCPYYLNHKTLCSQWEHPYFAKVLTEAEDYGDVIYAAYRTALKLLHIRNNMHLQSLRVDMISLAFNDVITPHCVKIDEYMTLKQIDEVMNKLYIYCDTSLNQSIWTGAMSSCLLYFFDGKKRGTVNTLGVIILLTMLCCDKLATKYSFLFQCLSEHDLVGPQDITHLKKTIFTVLTRLQEDKAYKNGYEGNGTCMTKDMFLRWLFTEPKFIVWLSTLHRIHAAVEARHEVKCYICKEYPIVGLRYRCLQCFNVDMCFQCFTRIPTYGKHDKSHAIEEYCIPSNKLQDVKAFITKVRNNIKKSKNSKRSSYEMEVTARRQPATVWHDPKLSTYTHTDNNNDTEKWSYTPIPSPAAERKSRPSSKTSSLLWDGYHSLSRGYAAYKNKDGTTVYADRYSNSLSRRQQRQPFNTDGVDIYGLPTSQNLVISSEIDNKPVSHYSRSVKATSHKTTQTPQYTPSDHYCDITTHYSARIKYNKNRELYAPSSRPTSAARHTQNFDFYSTQGTDNSHKYAVPNSNRQARRSIVSQHMPLNTDNRPGARGNLTSAYSEDEGVVINCESDSSGSHYATFDRTIYEDVDPINQHNSLKRVRNHDNTTLTNRSINDVDYTQYSLDRRYDTINRSTIYSDYTGHSYTPNGFATHSSTMNSMRRRGLVTAVEGVHTAMEPIAREYQV